MGTQFTGWGTASTVSPSRPSISSTTEETKGYTPQAGLKALHNASPLGTCTNPKKLLGSPRGWTSAPCQDGYPVLPEGAVLNGLYEAVLTGRLPAQSFVVEIVARHRDGSPRTDGEGTPVVTSRFFGICPKCQGTGLFDPEFAVTDSVDGHPNRCFSCLNHTRFNKEGHPLHRLTIVEYLDPSTYMDEVLLPACRVWWRAATQAVDPNVRAKAATEMVKIVLPFADSVRARLGMDVGMEERAALNELSVEGYLEAMVAQNPVCGGIWRHEQNGNEVGLASLVGALHQRFAPTIEQVERARRLKGQRSIGRASREGVAEFSTSPAFNGVELKVMKTEFNQCQDVIQSYRAWIATVTTEYLRSLGIQTRQADLLITGICAGKGLVTLFQQRGVGAKTIDACLADMGVSRSALAALENL